MLRDSAVSAEPESSRRVISEICRYNNASRFPPIVRAFFRHLAALNDRRIASARSADIFPDDFPARARAPPPPRRRPRQTQRVRRVRDELSLAVRRKKYVDRRSEIKGRASVHAR